MKWTVRGSATTVATFLLLSCASKPVEVWLWSDKEVPENFDDNSAVQPHPCGAIERKYLLSLPQEDMAGHELGSEKVVEHDGNGRIVRVWYTPIEPEVVAVAGSRIYLNYGVKSLSVDANGNLEEVSKRASSSEYIENCPVRALGGEYAGFLCWEIKDDQSGSIRHLASHIICT